MVLGLTNVASDFRYLANLGPILAHAPTATNARIEDGLDHGWQY